MAELTSLRNIGKRMEQRLKAVDISTAEELKEIGSKKAFLKRSLTGAFLYVTINTM